VNSSPGSCGDSVSDPGKQCYGEASLPAPTVSLQTYLPTSHQTPAICKATYFFLICLYAAWCAWAMLQAPFPSPLQGWRRRRQRRPWGSPGGCRGPVAPAVRGQHKHLRLVERHPRVPPAPQTALLPAFIPRAPRRKGKGNGYGQCNEWTVAKHSILLYSTCSTVSVPVTRGRNGGTTAGRAPGEATREAKPTAGR